MFKCFLEIDNSFHFFNYDLMGEKRGGKMREDKSQKNEQH
jgi:hypothetical protein